MKYQAQSPINQVVSRIRKVGGIRPKKTSEGLHHRTLSASTCILFSGARGFWIGLSQSLFPSAERGSDA